MSISGATPFIRSWAKRMTTQPIVFLQEERARIYLKKKGYTCSVCSVYAQMKFMTACHFTWGIEMRQEEGIAEAEWKFHSVWDHLRRRH